MQSIAMTLEAAAERHSRRLTAIVVGAILVIHLANVLAPAVDYDEASFVNVAATLATEGEYGNTWQFGRLTVPDRFASVGPPVVFPVAVAWRLGIQGPVGIRLVVMTPFFVAFLFFFSRLVSDFDGEARLLMFSLLIGLPAWGFFSARVLGEFPALCFACGGALLLVKQKWLPGGLVWGLAALTKLVFLPGLIFGWVLFCWQTQKGWRPVLWVAGATLAPLAVFSLWLKVKYGAWSDLSLSLQAGSVLFHPRNLPLNLVSLNRYMPLVFVALAGAFCWVERRTMPRLFLFGCLSSFWCLWHLVGQRGWPRHALPGLALLTPAVAASLRDIRRRQLPGYAKAALFTAMTAFVFVGLYENTYSIWTSYKAWRDQSWVVQYFRARPDRRFLGEGVFSPYPEYLWLSGIRFQDLGSVKPSRGDILVLSQGNRFLRREMAAGAIATWSWVFGNSTIEIYEKR